MIPSLLPRGGELATGAPSGTTLYGVTAQALQSDGKLVVVASGSMPTDAGFQDDLMLVRYVCP